jgi:hypothetical protein
MTHLPGSKTAASFLPIDAAGAAAGENGLNLTLDAQLVADIKAMAAAVKGALPSRRRRS